MVVELLGDLKDRRTPLDELNWIFTAITDTIAWTTLSRETLTRLYRCGLLIASLFRNFLAECIMRITTAPPPPTHTHTFPSLPATNTHPLWATWDLDVDSCLRQLPELLAKSFAAGALMTPSVIGSTPGSIGSTLKTDPNPLSTKQLSDKPYVHVPSRFFADQMTASRYGYPEVVQH